MGETSTSTSNSSAPESKDVPISKSSSSLNSNPLFKSKEDPDGHFKVEDEDMGNHMTRVKSMPAPLSVSSLEEAASFSPLKRSSTTIQTKLRHPLSHRYTMSNKERRDTEKRMDKLIHELMRKGALERNYTVRIDAENLDPSLLHLVDRLEYEHEGEEETSEYPLGTKVPFLNVCILIVGTRGDVQPFIAIGKRMKEYGHRVRLATHDNYREFVTEEGLEFYPLGGDPKILASYMVKNKGLLPSSPQEITTQRDQLRKIIFSTWSACTEPDKASDGAAFKADVIVANPPSLGHFHVAERLKIPLHVIFTMPWTPTHVWPHPLARLNQIAGFENKLSYFIVEQFLWMGVGDIVNKFRKKELKLSKITYFNSVLKSKNKVPTTYIWSPSLAPKPDDWGPKVSVVGFCFLDLVKNFTPPPDLVDWLGAGPKPIYIGFGSLPVEDPHGMTDTIIKSLKATNQRGIIQKGWGGLGEVKNPPDFVYLIDNCPHDWLFEQCYAVVHHGGAGTTAAGLKAACPTTVVPFFGDQPFWGHCCFEQGIGPEPISVDHFNQKHLVSAINFMLEPKVKLSAIKMSEKIKREDGVEGALQAFHKHLPPGIQPGVHTTQWIKKVSLKDKIKKIFHIGSKHHA